LIEPAVTLENGSAKQKTPCVSALCVCMWIYVRLLYVHVGWLKMTDMKLTDKIYISF